VRAKPLHPFPANSSLAGLATTLQPGFPQDDAGVERGERKALEHLQFHFIPSCSWPACFAPITFSPYVSNIPRLWRNRERALYGVLCIGFGIFLSFSTV
jgi:hypothetical protein